jgi:hypothetical protein
LATCSGSSPVSLPAHTPVKSHQPCGSRNIRKACNKGLPPDLIINVCVCVCVERDVCIAIARLYESEKWYVVACCEDVAVHIYTAKRGDLGE